MGRVAELGKQQGEEACAEWPGSWALGGEGLWGDAEGCRKRDTDGHREGVLGGACSALPPIAFLCPPPFPPLCLGGGVTQQVHPDGGPSCWSQSLQPSPAALCFITGLWEWLKGTIPGEGGGETQLCH